MRTAPQRWTTLNLAALWLAVTAAENQRTGLVRLPELGAGRALARLMDATDGALEDEVDVLEAAVVFERVSGTSWAAIGATLGRSAGWAEARFVAVERRFRLDEAFPQRTAAPAALRFPEACRRWLDTALVRRGSEPVAFGVDDATWRAHEEAAVALMEHAIATGTTPAGVSALDACAQLEDRRAALGDRGATALGAARGVPVALAISA